MTRFGFMRNEEGCGFENDAICEEAMRELVGICDSEETHPKKRFYEYLDERFGSHVGKMVYRVFYEEIRNRPCK